MSNIIKSLITTVIIDENGHIRMGDTGKYIGMLDPGPGMSYKEIYNYMVERSITMHLEHMSKALNSGQQTSVANWANTSVINNTEVTARLKESINKRHGLNGRPLLTDEDGNR